MARLTRRTGPIAGVLALVLATTVFVGPGGADTPGATLVVEPATDLVDHQEVQVSGTGFPATFLVLLVCPSGATTVDDCGLTSGGTWLEVDGDGTFDATATANVRVFGADHEVAVDCRTPGACELIAFDLLSPQTDALARAPLHFDPSAPLTPSPTIAVDPSSDLVDGDTVVVTGTGFRPDEGVTLAVCADHGGTTACRQPGWTFTDDAGAIDHSLRLRTILRAWTASGPAEIDCRLVACRLVARSDLGLWSNAVDLHFDPTAPLLDPPTLAITPDTDLVDGDVVTLTVADFGPDAYLDVEVCALGPDLQPLGCTWKPGFSTDAAGNASTAFGLRTRIRPWDPQAPLLDCRAVPCTVTVTDYASEDAVTVPLHFAPDGPLLPPPTLTVTPDTDIVEGEVVAVSGAGFVAGEWVNVELCAVASTTCDDQTSRSASADEAGTFALELRPAGTFTHWSGTTVDCRTAPGCEVVASADGPDVVRVPVTFGPPPPPRGRWLDPVFAEVDVTHDVVYRTAVDSRGNTVDLKMDIYQPVGDALGQRPALMWMHGGWFIFGDKSSMADYARESASRGYVAISLQYRLRPEITPADLVGVVDAAYDAYDDATAAVEWLIDNAATYRIDPRAILVGGYSAGGVLSWNLSYLPGERGPDAPLVAGGAPIAGIPFTGPEPGDPPIIGFHATNDPTVPVGGGRERCAEAVAIAVVCEWIEYPTGGHGIVSSEFRDIVRRSHDFFFEQVLAPLGYRTGTGSAPPIRPGPGDRTTPTAPATSSVPTTPSVPTTSPTSSTPSTPTVPFPSTTTAITPPGPAPPTGPTRPGAPPRPRPPAAGAAQAVPGAPSYAG